MNDSDRLQPRSSAMLLRHSGRFMQRTVPLTAATVGTAGGPTVTTATASSTAAGDIMLHKSRSAAAAAAATLMAATASTRAARTALSSPSVRAARTTRPAISGSVSVNSGASSTAPRLEAIRKEKQALQEMIYGMLQTPDRTSRAGSVNELQQPQHSQRSQHHREPRSGPSQPSRQQQHAASRSCSNRQHVQQPQSSNREQLKPQSDHSADISAGFGDDVFVPLMDETTVGTPAVELRCDTKTAASTTSRLKTTKDRKRLVSRHRRKTFSIDDFDDEDGSRRNDGSARRSRRNDRSTTSKHRRHRQSPTRNAVATTSNLSKAALADLYYAQMSGEDPTGVYRKEVAAIERKERKNSRHRRPTSRSRRGRRSVSDDNDGATRLKRRLKKSTAAPSDSQHERSNRSRSQHHRRLDELLSHDITLSPATAASGAGAVRSGPQSLIESRATVDGTSFASMSFEGDDDIDIDTDEDNDNDDIRRPASNVDSRRHKQTRVRSNHLDIDGAADIDDDDIIEHGDDDIYSVHQQDQHDIDDDDIIQSMIQQQIPKHMRKRVPRNVMRTTLKDVSTHSQIAINASTYDQADVSQRAAYCNADSDNNHLVLPTRGPFANVVNPVTSQPDRGSSSMFANLIHNIDGIPEMVDLQSCSTGDPSEDTVSVITTPVEIDDGDDDIYDDDEDFVKSSARFRSKAPVKDSRNCIVPITAAASAVPAVMPSGDHEAITTPPPVSGTSTHDSVTVLTPITAATGVDTYTTAAPTIVNNRHRTDDSGIAMPPLNPAKPEDDTRPSPTESSEEKKLDSIRALKMSDTTQTSATTADASHTLLPAGPFQSVSPEQHRERCLPISLRPDAIVSFGNVDVRYYETILCDNPGCRTGPSIGIGWMYQDGGSLPVDDWERNGRYAWMPADEPRRPPRRPAQLMLSRQERLERLAHWGYSHSQIVASIRLIRKYKNQRKQTITNLSAAGIEEIVEQAKRRVLSMVSLRKRAGPQT